MTEIKPCPFCGGELYIRRSLNPYGRCETEGCYMNMRKDTVPLEHSEAVQAWNNRPIEDKLKAKADMFDDLIDIAEDYIKEYVKLFNLNSKHACVVSCENMRGYEVIKKAKELNNEAQE